MQSQKQNQHGMSFIGFIMGGFVLIVVAIFGMKVIPAYIHNGQISQIFREIAADPALRGAPMKDVEMSYRKRASINDINDLKVEDVTIDTDGGSLKLSANYFVKIPLVGNATLLLEFNPSSK